LGALFTTAIIVVCLLFLVVCCSTLWKYIRIRKPELEVRKVAFKDISFKSVDLEVLVKVYNPNKLSVTMSGFDYDLSVNNVSLLTGNEKTRLTIEALGENVITIPLKLFFKDLRKTFKTLKTSANSGYTITCKLYFDLPLLGKIEIPVSKRGELPFLKRRN